MVESFSLLSKAGCLNLFFFTDAASSSRGNQGVPKPVKKRSPAVPQVVFLGFCLVRHPSPRRPPRGFAKSFASQHELVPS